MKNIYILIFLAAVCSLQVFAQNKKGDKLYKYYNYSEAIPFYLKAVESGNVAEQDYATQKLADCYRLTNNVPKARQWYEKVVLYYDTDPINYFYLGQAYRGLGMYSEAAGAFETYNMLVPGSVDGQQFYNYCIDIQEWADLPPSAEIKNIEEMNTKYSDFCPVFYREGIVFTSDRLVKLLDKKNTYGWTNRSYLDLFYTIPEYFKVFWNGVPEPHKMSQEYNQAYHDGPACFSADNQWIFLTRTIARKGKKLDDNIKTHLLKIYYAKITGDKRPDFKEFKYNSDDYSVGHAALSKDAQKIIFSSDMPGGYGGSDLYMCVMENGKWNEPINLGDKINSNRDEVFPYWASDDVLFFSSDGHLGYGGLDIFQSNMKAGEWGEPVNLKTPLNSSYDDFGIVAKDDLKEGLFSSNRPEGKGSDDIYGFRKLDETPLVIIPEKKFVVSGYVKDFETKAPLNMATVFLLNPSTNDVEILKTDSEGFFETEALIDQPYVAKAMKNGYVYDCISFNTDTEPDAVEYNLPRDLLLTKLKVNQVFAVENIYYDLDKWFIRKDAEEPLDNLVRIMKQYPITAELSSHTDCRASDEYNNELSQKRAESAVRYIFLHGINPARLTAKGYGETKLVNRCADGVPCTEEEHQQNRRTEFKITSVNDKLHTENSFNPDVFVEGDIVKSYTFEYDFFSNCLSGSAPLNFQEQIAQHKSIDETIVDRSDEKTVGKASNEKIADKLIREKAVVKIDEKKEPKLIAEIPSSETVKANSGTVYRVQLVATSKTLDVASYFSKISDLIKQYDITEVKVANLNKYQVGNFETSEQANEAKNILRQRGYKDCFVVKVEN